MNEKAIKMGQGYINGGFTSNIADEKVWKRIEFMYFMKEKWQISTHIVLNARVRVIILNLKCMQVLAEYDYF